MRVLGLLNVSSVVKALVVLPNEEQKVVLSKNSDR